MPETVDRLLQSALAWLTRIRDDAAELERVSAIRRRVIDLSRDIDVDAVNATNILAQLRPRLTP